MPFIDLFLSTHIRKLTNRNIFYQWQNNDEVKFSFFKKAEQLFKDIGSETISDQEWQYFLNLLAIRVNKDAAVLLSELFLSELHSMKRTFVKKYEKPLINDRISFSQRFELVTEARVFLKNISLFLPSYRIMKPKKIDIVPEIEQHLLKDYLETKKKVVDNPAVIYIAGYDGICEDYLRPMLIEIRSNAERALSQIKSVKKRIYEIKVFQGENDYSDYLILSVEN